ncbi:hypothetical protein Syun_022703 [Stephania yunnanensis]|uniref:Uncharacterized protein n=1 Tax=Stephania yunnanensis TaxID=152371 RepID=A0AAP0I1Q4_9MAGN
MRIGKEKKREREREVSGRRQRAAAGSSAWWRVALRGSSERRWSVEGSDFGGTGVLERGVLDRFG